MEGKRFEEWIEVKSDLHKIAIVRRMREGEIWWCALGEMWEWRLMAKARLSQDQY